MIGIFNRWCLKELVKTIIFCLSAFYLLYVLIDYSSRISSYQAIRFEWWMLFEYYGLIFIRRLEALLPFALLIATASTLQKIWQLHGWIPLLQGGRSIRKLLTPFYAVAFLSTLFLLYNEQSLIPLAMKRLNHIESLYFHKGEGISELNTRSSIRLKEGGFLFFDSFDAKKQALVDVWYLPRWNEIWHIEKLDISRNKPIGTMVDMFTIATHLIEEREFIPNVSQTLDFRTSQSPGVGRSELARISNTSEALIAPTAAAFASAENQSLRHVGYREQLAFDRLNVTWEDLLEASIDPLNLSITDLINQPFGHTLSPQEKNECFATLLKKLLFPTLAIFAILAIIPFFITFQRDAPFFIFYLVAILSYIGFYLLISSLYMISLANVFSPLLALVIPFSALLSFMIWKYKRGPV